MAQTMLKQWGSKLAIGGAIVLYLLPLLGMDFSTYMTLTIAGSASGTTQLPKLICRTRLFRIPVVSVPPHHHPDRTQPSVPSRGRHIRSVRASR